ncbi:MAG: hypothetical protein AAGI91_04845 [Bacteroidota bacterium]
MNRLAHIALLPLLALSLALTGCDSDSEDDTPVEERILGTWEVTSASARVNTGVFGTVSVPVLDASSSGSISVSFDGSGFTFRVTGPIGVDAELLGFGMVTVLEDGETVVNEGTYTIAEGGQQLRLTTTEVNGETIPASSVAVDFELRGGDTLALTVENTPEGREAIESLLGEDFPEELLDLIEGGETTFNRAN